MCCAGLKLQEVHWCAYDDLERVGLPNKKPTRSSSLSLLSSESPTRSASPRSSCYSSTYRGGLRDAGYSLLNRVHIGLVERWINIPPYDVWIGSGLKGTWLAIKNWKASLPHHTRVRLSRSGMEAPVLTMFASGASSRGYDRRTFPLFVCCDQDKH